MVTLDQAGAGAAAVRLMPPSAALRARVQHLWVETQQATGGRGLGGWRIVADHCGHLLYHRMRRPDGTVTHRLVLVGPRTVAVDIDKRRRLVTAGVRLQPWSLPVLFDVTAAEIGDRSVALEDVLGSHTAELAERLEGSTPEKLPGVLERWLAPFARPAESRTERRAHHAAQLLTVGRRAATPRARSGSAHAGCARSCTRRSASRRRALRGSSDCTVHSNVLGPRVVPHHGHVSPRRARSRIRPI